jgi:hypothetical protein
MLLAALLVTCVVAPLAASAQPILSASGGREVRLELPDQPNPAPAGSRVSLFLDDGSRETSIGIGGTAQFIFLNRFTPAAGSYPFLLREVEVFFSTEGLVNVGDDIKIVIYQNTAGNADPAVGSNLVATFPTTVQAVDGWSYYTLGTPVLLNGPGDVLIGVVALEMPGTPYWPASIDQTATQQRSWAGWWNSATAPELVTLPPDAAWSMVDGFGSSFAGNWMIRGFGNSTVPGDLDNDGKVDLAVYYPADGTWYVKGTAGANLTKNWGWSATVPVPADYDFDGVNDLAVYYPANGTWYVKGSAGTNLTQNWGWSATIPVPADWDGDGRTDIAVYYPANGTWYIRGTAGTNLTQNWGWAATTPVPGDYDGDGRLDLAVYYQADGNWYIKGSAGTNLTLNWGWSAAMPVQADWDGDRVTDLAVYYPVNGTWYIKGTSGTNLTLNWGWNAAWPVPAAWDSDWNIDQAVYYPANGTWYVKGSVGANLTKNWGWSGADPIFLQYQINKLTGFIR